MQFCLAGWSWSAWTSPRQSAAPTEHRVLQHVGQVLRAIDLHFIVGGDFNLAGDVLEQSGWLHEVRARVAAPSNDTPTCLDSTGKGKVIDFFVVSEELQSLLTKTPHSHTHSPACGFNAGGSEAWEASPKAAQARQASKDCTSGPVEETAPEQRWSAWHAERVRATETLGRRGAHNTGRGGPATGTHSRNDSPRPVRPGRRGKYTGRVAVPITRQQQLLARRGPGAASGGEAALWNALVQRIGALSSMLAKSTHGQGLQRHLQHTSQDLLLVMAFLAPPRDVELVEELAQKFGAVDGCKAADCTGGWSD